MPPVHGVELSRRFYVEIVAPWLGREFPGLRHAAALIGSGSEVLGFDDEMSRDHGFGVRVQLYLAEEDFPAVGEALIRRFALSAPESFLGTPAGGPAAWRKAGALGDDRHGLEIWTPERALRHWLAIDADAPPTGRTWLGLAEQRLLSLTAGAVFHDDSGELTALRERFAYFPRDVWAYLLACQWRRIAEEQAFVGRAGMVGDELGSRVIAARLVRDAIRMAFLISRRYAPYPKWFGAAFQALPCAGELSPILDRVLGAPDCRIREAALADSYLALANLHLAGGLPGMLHPRIGPYFSRPFTVINADEIAAAIRAEIVDPSLRELPLIGSLDQVTDSTPLIEAPAAAQAAMQALFDDVEAGAVEKA
jgi:hypothetical protein